MELPFKKADILIPNNEIDLSKWAVIACDQYTSDANYWNDVKRIVGNNKSTYNITLPEIYLNDNDVENKILNINKTMKKYIDDNIFKEYKDSMFYIERTQSDGLVREGLIGMLDLEAYDFNQGSTTLVRATEKTIIERIPPRVKVRENALIELPHIMVLIDDDKKEIIESIKDKVNSTDLVYDFDLMKNSGHLKGYKLNDSIIDFINEKLMNMMEKEAFNKKYNVTNKEVLLFAMGDGNHSLATAKQCYENLKKTTTPDVYLNSKARYALVEIVNLNSDALKFEPIHRVLFDVNYDDLFSSLSNYYDLTTEEDEHLQKFTIVKNNSEATYYIRNPKSNLSVGSIQIFLDKYIKENNIKIDYIHEDEAVRNLVKDDNNVGFIFDAMKKEELFRTVILDGALPRKTFSMGHSDDKRFYLESRIIK